MLTEAFRDFSGSCVRLLSSGGFSLEYHARLGGVSAWGVFSLVVRGESRCAVAAGALARTGCHDLVCLVRRGKLPRRAMGETLAHGGCLRGASLTAFMEILKRLTSQFALNSS